MPLLKQSAYISPNKFDVQIGGTFIAPLPLTAIVPSWAIQVDNTIIPSGKGVWINAFDYYQTNSVGATSFAFPNLEGCTAGFMSNTPSSTITSIDAPNLLYSGFMGGTFVTYANLTTISLPKIVYLGSFFSSCTLPVTTLNLTSLVFIGQLQFNVNSLTSLDLSSLRQVGSSISLNSTSCTSVNLSSIISVGSTFTLGMPLLTTLTLPTLGTWKALSGNVSLGSASLNQTSVDNLLSALAYMDGTNNTLAYGSGKTVTISAGLSSAPTNLGSITTAGSNFVGSTTTCTVNLTSHGYATGDVLRISGITTLTNANKYAVITVVNANQFTYTITSQTATGAGTATVVKAGASAKALVTRGVTLTTN